MINQWLRGWEEEEGGGLGLPPTCPHIYRGEERGCGGIARGIAGIFMFCAYGRFGGKPCV